MKNMSSTLSVNDRVIINRAVKTIGVDVLASTVARLYVAFPIAAQKWTYTNIVGAIVLLKDSSENNAKYFRMVDLSTGKLVWEQEIYGEIQYKQDRPFFHSFATDYCMAGFSFANEEEARHFFTIVSQNIIDHQPKGTLEVKSKKSLLSALRHKERDDIDISSITIDDISAPTDFRHVYHVGYNSETGFDLQNIPPEWRTIFERAGVTQNQLRDKSTAQFIYHFMQNNSQSVEKNGSPLISPSNSSTMTSSVTMSSGRAPLPYPSTSNNPPPRPPPTPMLPPLSLSTTPSMSSFSSSSSIDSSLNNSTRPVPPPVSSKVSALSAEMPSQISYTPSIESSRPLPDPLPRTNIGNASSIPIAPPMAPDISSLALTDSALHSPMSSNRADLLAAIQKSDISSLRKVDMPSENRQLSVSSQPVDMAGALARALAERNKVMMHSDDEEDDDDDNEW